MLRIFQGFANLYFENKTKQKKAKKNKNIYIKCSPSRLIKNILRTFIGFLESQRSDKKRVCCNGFYCHRNM